MSPISTSTRPYFLEVIVPKDLIFEGRSQNRELSNIILRYRRRELEGKSLTKNRDKYPDQNPDQTKFEISTPIGTPIKLEEKGARYSPKHRAPAEQRKKEVGPPPRDAQGRHSRKWARRHKQATHPRPQRTSKIMPVPGQRGPVGGQTQKRHKKKAKAGILNTFKGRVPEFGAVLVTKDDHYKESFQKFQECVLQYVVENYKKGVDLDTLVRKL